MPSPIDRLIEKLETESRRLEHEFKVELPQAIGTAREHGDLSENAEYHAARERHAFVKARLGQVAAQIEKLKSIDVSKIPDDRVGLYSQVSVFDLDSEEDVEFELVTGEEADPDNGRISISSPLGQGLAGRQEGDETTIRVPAGTRRFEVGAVKTLHDRAGDPGRDTAS